MKRGYYLAVKARNQTITDRIEALKGEHPFWGYRRIWAYLTYHDKLEVSKNRVYRIMKQADLLVKENTKLRAKRTANTSKPKPSIPNQWWGIDMTELSAFFERKTASHFC